MALIDAPPTRGNVPTRNADGIDRHANKRHVRTAFMPADVGYWKWKRRADARRDNAVHDEPTREIVRAKSVRRARVIG